MKMARAAKKIGIDIGSKNVRAVLLGSGRVLCEPAIFALGISDGKIIAFGKKADSITKRIPGSAQIVRPFAGDVTPDRHFVYYVIKHMIKRLCGEKVGNVELAVSYSGIPDKTMESYFSQGAYAVGVNSVYIVDDLFAAAYGANAKISSDIVLVSIGASVTDMGIFSHGKLVCSKTLTTAGNAYDRAIAGLIYDKYNLRISEAESERVKLELAALDGSTDEKTAETIGIHKYSGVPRKMSIPGSVFNKVLKDLTEEIVDTVYSMFYDVRFELSSMILTGGGAMLPGLEKELAEQINIPVTTAKQPDMCVIRGLERMLNDRELDKLSL